MSALSYSKKKKKWTRETRDERWEDKTIDRDRKRSQLGARQRTRGAEWDKEKMKGNARYNN